MTDSRGFCTAVQMDGSVCPVFYSSWTRDGTHMQKTGSGTPSNPSRWSVNNCLVFESKLVSFSQEESEEL